MQCFSFCVGNEIDLNALDEHLREKKEYQVYRLRSVLQLCLNSDKKQIIFFFPNGTFISWNVKHYQTQHWLDEVSPFVVQPLHPYVRDEFSYIYSDDTTIKPHHYFDVDCMTLENQSDELKMSIAYGLSQSIKLNSYEMRIERLISQYMPMIESLKETRFKLMTRRKLQQIVAEVLVEKSELNLVSNFAYQPTFFWQHPSLEGYYSLIEAYMDIEKRVSIINQRLDTLNGIFDVIHGYLDNQHSHHLEIIIIVLIAIEIIFNLLNLHL